MFQRNGAHGSLLQYGSDRETWKTQGIKEACYEAAREDSGWEDTTKSGAVIGRRTKGIQKRKRQMKMVALREAGGEARQCDTRICTPQKGY